MPIFKSIKSSVKVDDFAEPGAFNKWIKGAVIIAVIFCLAGLFLVFYLDGCIDGVFRGRKDDATATTNDVSAAQESKIDLFNPVRPAPPSFPPNSSRPLGRESKNSGAIDLKTFDPKKDLIVFNDSRVWFESDHDPSDTENDHLINSAMEIPLKRLVNLVEKKGGTLKIHDAYRPITKDKMIHLENSLHREGRAVDLTSDQLSLTELAKLCWQAGFDYVLYEVPKRGGRHLHCSVKRILNFEE